MMQFATPTSSMQRPTKIAAKQIWNLFLFLDKSRSIYCVCVPFTFYHKKKSLHVCCLPIFDLIDVKYIKER